MTRKRLVFGWIVCAVLGGAVARPVTDVDANGWRAACAKGDGHACNRLAAALHDGHVRALVREEEGLARAASCTSGDERACEETQALARTYGDYEVLELDVGCILGENAFACEEVAEALARDDDGMEKGTLERILSTRSHRALALHERACKAGDARACMGIARVHAAGLGVAWNPKEANAWAEAKR